MKLLLSVCIIATVLLSVVSSAVLDYDQIAVTNHLVNKINSNPNSSWKAGHNKFSDMTIGEIMPFLGAHKPINTPESRRPVSMSRFSANDIPTEFDSRTEFPGCVHEIRDQGHCGSCWAFAASGVLQDRLCIASNGAINVTLSPQSLVSCDNRMNLGCRGGYPDEAWKYIVNTGIPTEECYPYISGDTKSSGVCQKTCSDKSSMRMFKGKVGTIQNLHSEREIQLAILQHGPVEGTFMVYQDFMAYKSGVYSRSPTAARLDGHAIRIVGWGHDQASGKNYWIIANSWGPTWGENGYVRFERGINSCGIERDASAVEASLDRSRILF
eukprot:gene2426-2996_t